MAHSITSKWRSDPGLEVYKIEGLGFRDSNVDPSLINPLSSIGLGFRSRPLMNKPPPHNRDYSRDPHIKALKRKRFINHGSTLLKFILITSPEGTRRIWGGFPDPWEDLKNRSLYRPMITPI